jgi:hypothetical protein
VTGTRWNSRDGKACRHPTGTVGASRRPHAGEVVSASPGMVRAEGLEPPQLSSLEPKSSASTNSATPADSMVSSRDTVGGGLITSPAGPRQKRPSLATSDVPAETGHGERKMVGIYHD